MINFYGKAQNSLSSASAQSIDSNFVTEAVKGLADSNVYVNKDASLSKSSEIQDQIEGTDVGVAVLPSMSNGTLSADQIASQILNSSEGYKKIIVVIDNNNNDLYGVATFSKDDREDMLIALNTNNTGDGGEMILSQIDTLTSATTSTTVDTGSLPDTDGGVSMGAIALTGGGLIGVAAAVTVGFVVFQRVMREKGKKTAKVDMKVIPNELRKKIEELSSLSKAHMRAGNTEVVTNLNHILANLQELFKRIEKKGTQSQANLAAITYEDNVTKLTQALGSEYYLDIAESPNLWDNPQTRMREVEEALVAVDSELVNNIRQINASRDLEFQVALEVLTQSVERVSPKDMITPKRTFEN